MGSQIITSAQFEETLTKIYRASETVARRNRWCCEWLKVFARLSPVFTPYHKGGLCGDPDYDSCGITLTIPPPASELDPSWFQPGSYEKIQVMHYTAELDRIRGRIIRIWVLDRITARQAENVLRAAGLNFVFTACDAIALL
jgi:hypothetical protein